MREQESKGAEVQWTFSGLGVGVWILITLLPFHLFLKRTLPAPIGTYWKEVLLGLLVLIWLGHSLRQRKLLLPRAALNLPVTLFFAFLLFRFFVGLRTSDFGLWTLGLLGLYVLIKYIPLYFVVLGAIDIGFLPPTDEAAAGGRQLAYASGFGFRVAALMLAVGIVCALGALLEFILDRHFLLSEDIRQIYGSYDLYIYATKVRRVYFTFDFPGALGSFLAMLIPLAVAFIPVADSTRLRLLLIGAGLILAAGLALTFSRGPWLGLIAALAFMAVVALLLERNIRRFFYVVLAAIVLVLLFLAIGALASARAPDGMGNVVVAQFLSTGELEEPTNVPRVEAWRRSFEILKAYPVLGIGLGRTGSVAWRFLPPGEALITESQVLKIAVETGLIGLLLFLALWLSVFITGLRTYVHLLDAARADRLCVPASPCPRVSEPARALLLGLMAALASVFVHGLGYQVLELKQTDMAVWLFIALISHLSLWRSAASS